MSASAAAFDTFELLEMIIVQLPVHDILVARAVCRNWNSLIESSLQIRRSTFRAPNGGEYLALVKRQPNAWPVPVRMSPADYTVCPLLGSTVKTQSATYFNIDRQAISLPRIQLLELAGSLSVTPFFRSLLLTRPPCTAVSLMNDVNASLGTGVHIASLRNEQGVTVGLLADTVKTLLVQARKTLTPTGFQELLASEQVVLFEMRY